MKHTYLIFKIHAGLWHDAKIAKGGLIIYTILSLDPAWTDITNSTTVF